MKRVNKVSRSDGDSQSDAEELNYKKQKERNQEVNSRKSRGVNDTQKPNGSKSNDVGKATATSANGAAASASGSFVVNGE